MIAVDTSALMAVVAGEPAAKRCIAALEAEDEILISAVTMAEALIVAERRSLGDQMSELLAEFGFTIEPTTATTARQAASAYRRWGKGVHPAGLNFGDCFAYALAKENDCPLLFVGADFAATDLTPASRDTP